MVEDPAVCAALPVEELSVADPLMVDPASPTLVDLAAHLLPALVALGVHFKYYNLQESDMPLQSCSQFRFVTPKLI